MLRLSQDPGDSDGDGDNDGDNDGDRLTKKRESELAVLVKSGGVLIKNGPVLRKKPVLF